MTRLDGCVLYTVNSVYGDEQTANELHTHFFYFVTSRTGDHNSKFSVACKQSDNV